MLELCTLASGSSGNCLVARTAQGSLLLDAGISCKRICEGLQTHRINPAQLDGILITHEHSDHISGLQVFLKRYPVPIYTSAATGRQITYRIAGADRLIRPVEAGSPFSLAGVTVTPFSTPHDAAGSLGFVLETEGKRAAVCTDVGHLTDEVRQAVLGADFVLMEANYEEEWLLSGPYPYPLKQRILGDRGHLSNADGAELACMLAEQGTKTLVLGHLSKENNTPARAHDVVCAKLEQRGYQLGSDIRVEVAPRSQCGPVWQVG